MKVREFIKLLVPPLFIYFPRKILSQWSQIIEFEYVPEGWQIEHMNPKIKGWNAESIFNESKWLDFKTFLQGNLPLGITHEAAKLTNVDLASHNTILSFAYVLALASRNKSRVSILDWGGGIGHYYLISRAVLPSDVKIDYHCKDVPVLSEYGKKILPEATFYTSDSDFLGKKFDLVVASGSLQYVRNWKEILQSLTSITDGYLYITRLPIVTEGSSYVIIQRPYSLGHNNEYLFWALNRELFLNSVLGYGKIELIREFILGEKYNTLNAPAVNEVRGFLFRTN